MGWVGHRGGLGCVMQGQGGSLRGEVGHVGWGTNFTE